jgi:hypothetical protein
MSASGQHSTSASPSGVVDPLDLLDFTDYDGLSYQSPTVSPPTANKQHIARPSSNIATPAALPTTQPMNGPSHQYDQYKQQTPFVPGALASTMAVNQSNTHINGGYNMYTMSPEEDLFDFNSAPQQSSPEMDVDFDSPGDSSFMFADQTTINPSAIGARESQPTLSPTLPSQTSNVGRMYPGMHQQAALAKAQQQRQQQMMQQQRQGQPPKSQQRSKVPMPSDPIVEQKITQLLNSMRSKPSTGEAGDNSPLMHISRPKKEEDDMDEDERLLASEEGKKLSSKERRQLRNKVSARAFRSRRKEYISQLEAEIAGKVSENGDLRAQNRALADENRRLTDLTRMLLSSPSFSTFLDTLSTNPASLPRQQQQQQQQPAKPEQRQPEPQQAPKDVNPYAALQGQQQQIGMAMIPEQSMDFSMLNLDGEFFFQQPRVFTVLETPEMPEIDAAILSGKTSGSAIEPLSLDDKIEIPAMEAPVLSSLEKSQLPATLDEAYTPSTSPANLDGDIFDDEAAPVSTPSDIDTASLSSVEIFNGIETEKAFARYELVDATEEEAATNMTVRRVERLSASLESTLANLERLTMGL